MIAGILSGVGMTSRGEQGSTDDRTDGGTGTVGGSNGDRGVRDESGGREEAEDTFGRSA